MCAAPPRRHITGGSPPSSSEVSPLLVELVKNPPTSLNSTRPEQTAKTRLVCGVGFASSVFVEVGGGNETQPVVTKTPGMSSNTRSHVCAHPAASIRCFSGAADGVLPASADRMSHPAETPAPLQNSARCRGGRGQGSGSEMARAREGAEGAVRWNGDVRRATPALTPALPVSSRIPVLPSHIVVKGNRSQGGGVGGGRSSDFPHSSERQAAQLHHTCTAQSAWRRLTKSSEHLVTYRLTCSAERLGPEDGSEVGRGSLAGVGGKNAAHRRENGPVRMKG